MKGYYTEEYIKPRMANGRLANKLASIQRVKHIMDADTQNVRISISMVYYYNNLLKKDDLAECFLKVWSYR